MDENDKKVSLLFVTNDSYYLNICSLVIKHSYFLVFCDDNLTVLFIRINLLVNSQTSVEIILTLTHSMVIILLFFLLKK